LHKTNKSRAKPASSSRPCGVALKPLERFVSGAFCVSVARYVAVFRIRQSKHISPTNKARLLSLKPLRSSAAMSRSPLENVAVLLRVFLWVIGVPRCAGDLTVSQARKNFVEGVKLFVSKDKALKHKRWGFCLCWLLVKKPSTTKANVTLFKSAAVCLVVVVMCGSVRAVLA